MRLKQLDLLRAVAILLVLGRHMHVCPADQNLVIHHVTTIWQRGGWVGVDLFFVLSGFLVSGLLFKEYQTNGQIKIKRFLIRRGFKIYPSFWLLILATAIVWIFQKQPPTLRALATELLFLQNYRPAMCGFTWSLAVEEHFYFILVIGFYLLLKNPSRHPFSRVPKVFSIVATLCLALRVRALSHAPFEFWTHQSPSHLRLDSLFFGVLISYFYYFHPSTFSKVAFRLRHISLVAGIGFLSSAFIFPIETTPFIYSYGFTLFYFGSGCLLVSALGLIMSPSVWAEGIAYTGTHSYSIYLWHGLIGLWSNEIVNSSSYYNWYYYAVAYLGGSCVAGVTMANIIEFPILKIRERIFPSTSSIVNPPT